MKISKTNYEAYILDYLENRLSSTDKLELEEYLLQNPDLYHLLDDTKFPSIVPENTIFTSKNTLYKLDFEKAPVIPSNFSDYCIAWYENILTQKKKKEFTAFLYAHPCLKPEFELFGKTILKPEKNYIFPDKKKLAHPQKKSIQIIKLSYLLWSAAAASILLFIIFNIPPVNKSLPQTKLASANSIKEVTIKSPQPKNGYLSSLLNKKEIENQQNKEITVQVANKEIAIMRDSNIQTIKTLICKSVQTDSKSPLLNNYDYLAQNNLQEPDKTNSIEINDNDNLLSKIPIKNQIIAFAEDRIRKINKIASDNLAFSQRVDELGGTSTFSIKAGIFEFSRKRTHLK